MSESTDELERVVFLNKLDPDAVDEYVDLHRDVPEHVTAAMERAGVADFRVYVRDDTAICVMEVRDVEEYLEVYVGDPEVEEWERRVNEYKREGIDVDGDGEQVPFMDEIWSFSPESGQSFSAPE